ncbi:MAG: ASKHA domain-containing protein [Planctomycetota bacterium]|jgi:uncharacterized 2Fe-2S/4Fe-4S cluster protein (DUF4445 family)|nr:ASKHA domain-containing protein [Planctomycetota bacterium]
MQIHFLPDNRTVELSAGESLLTAARRAGVELAAPCNGAGVCGKCLVRVAAGQSAPLGKSRHFAPAGSLLACETTAVSDLTVEIPRKKETGLQIHNHGATIEVELAPAIRKHYDGANTQIFAGAELLGTEAGDTTARVFGAVIDIGTTTLAVGIIDLLTGEEAAGATGLNPQTSYAQDVLGRIHFASGDGGLAILQSAVVAALNALIGEAADAAKIDTAQIYEAVVSGNTCMLQLALGLDPAPLGRHPYAPFFAGNETRPAAGLRIAPFGQIYAPPNIAGHIGADIVSGIVATDLAARRGTTLFVDIGTNGEMVVAQDGKMVGASTAAGPAFEGMNIACGMRAAAGAIERVNIEGENFQLRVIGDAPPVGICGSGLMDLVGELARCGVIDGGGRLGGNRDPNAYAAKILAERGRRVDGKARLTVADAVYLSQKDLRQVQLAKGAIRAGVDLLLKNAGVAAAAVDEVIIAGSFGYHLRAESLLNLGLLPRELAGKISFAGNTSKSGARLFLLNHAERARAAALARAVRAVNLAEDESFQTVFIAAMAFPAARE